MILLNKDGLNVCRDRGKRLWKRYEFILIPGGKSQVNKTTKRNKETKEEKYVLDR